MKRNWVKNDGPRGNFRYLTSPEVEQGRDDLQITEEGRNPELQSRPELEGTLSMRPLLHHVHPGLHLLLLPNQSTAEVILGRSSLKPKSVHKGYSTRLISLCTWPASFRSCSKVPVYKVRSKLCTMTQPWSSFSQPLASVHAITGP